MFLAGIKAELEQRTSLELLAVEARCPDFAALINTYGPQLVLFDISTEQPGFALTLLCEQPGLLLIGVDSCSDQILLLSSQPVQALNISDLVKVIKKELSAVVAANDADVPASLAADSRE
jgi:hypothetical protein